MAFVTGAVVLDAPASALNNAGQEAGATTDNAIVVKKIRTPNGVHAYVSAQAVRYWIRTSLETNEPKWKAAPVHREGKIAYTDAEPIEYWDDDLFGYMRAPSKKTDAAKAAGAGPLEKDREITRISPFRVGTFVSIAPASIVSDFGTMARQQGDPVPYEHEFYRAHLLGLLSVDLTAAGTFFDGERVGFKNLDTHRREQAQKSGLTEATVRKQKAYRLPLSQRMERVSTLLRGLAALNGGAKQTLHYTDLTPAVVFLAVTEHGNNPFYRVFTSSRTGNTEFHRATFEEVMTVYEAKLRSKVYVGWASGFLDDEREKLKAAVAEKGWSNRVAIAHPATQMEAFASELAKAENASWYD
jgi:CRISPR-associated protein Cst2